MKVLNREGIIRMGGRSQGGGGVSVGGGSGSVAGLASEAWVEENYISKAFFNRLFTIHSATGIIDPNDPDEEETIDSIESLVGFWTEYYLSALGQGSGGGGGGGVTLNEPLSSINNLGAPTGTNKVLLWNGSSWGYSAITAGSVTSVGLMMPTGFNVTNTPVTSSGTLNVTFTTGYSLPTTAKQDNWDTAYGWGNHADAGYALASNVYSKADADAKFMTIAAFENLFNALNSSNQKVSHPYSSNVASIKALVGLWTEQYISALGQSSGGGGSITLNEPLASINSIGAPTGSNKILLWNGSSWTYSSASSGSVTGIVLGSGNPYTPVNGVVTLPAYPSTSGLVSGISVNGGNPISPVSGIVALTGLATTSDLSGYLPLTGGSLTGALGIASSSSGWAFYADATDGTNVSYSRLSKADGTGFYLGSTLSTNVSGKYIFTIRNGVSASSASGGNTIMHINGSGKVGIGTDSPAYALDVNGTIRVGNSTYTNLLGVSSMYLELGSAGNEMVISCTSNTTMHINYRSSGLSKTIPTSFIWNKGSSSTYADHTMGKVTANGGFVGNLTGNADTATSATSASTAAKLTTARTLWGQSFDGSANISGALSDTGSITPSSNSTYNIGSSTLYYLKVYSDYIYVSSANYITTESGYLALGTNGNELRIGAGAASLYINYGGVTGKTTVTSYYWYAGNGYDSYASFYLGDIISYGNIKTSTSNGAYVQIGGIRIVYDSTNNALKVVQSDGSTAANFYATGGVGALGLGSSGQQITLNQPLSAINSAGLSAPTTNGSVLVYNNGWKYSSAVGIFATAINVAGTATAAGFKATGKDNTYVLLADGGTALLSDIGGGSYLPLSGGTLTGILTISVGSVSGYQDALVIHDENSGANKGGRIRFTSTSYTTGITLGSNSDKTKLLINDTYTIWHSGNLTDVSQLTNDAGYTTNIGTVTTIKLGTTSYSPSSGVVSLPAYPTQMDWTNITNKPNVALQASANNFIYSGNEVVFASSGYTGSVYVGYRTTGGTNGSYSYEFYNGAGSYATIKASYFTANSTTLCTNLNADLLDGHHDGDITAKYLNTISDNFNLSRTASLYLLTCASPKATGAPSTYTSGISIMTDYVGFQLMTYGGADEYLYFRRVEDNGTWHDWKYIAFTDSNVASATKLQTARTLWGQSFNGTANVSGALTDTGSITPSATDTYNVGSSSLFYSKVYSKNIYVSSANYITTESGYLTLATLSNEMRIGADASALYINYRGVTGKTTVTEYRWYTGGGNNGSYAKFVVGSVESSGNISTSSSNGAYVQIGAIRLVYDSTNNAIKIVKSDGSTAANLYTTGGLSALGQSSTSSSYLDQATADARYLKLSGGQTITGSFSGTSINLSSQIKSTNAIASAYMTVGTGTLNTSYTLYVNGTASIANLTLNNSTASTIGVASGGKYLSIVVGSSGHAVIDYAWVVTSDMRRKEIVSNVGASIEQIASAPIFNYRLKGDLSGSVSLGTSAQYWRGVFPCGVSEMPDTYLSMDYGATALAAAVITARTVQTHEQRIAALEAENERLRNEIEQLKAA